MKREPSEGLTSVAVRGFAYQGGQAVIGRLATLASQYVLSWFLLPQEFGLVSMAYTVTGFASIFTQLGVREFVINRPRTVLWVEPASWMALALAVFSALVMVAIAPIAASFYRSPQVIGLIAVLALAQPFYGLSTVISALMQKRAKFGTLSVIGTLGTLFGAVLSIVLAKLGFGAYSFVIPVPATAALQVVLQWKVCSLRVKWRPRPHVWRHFLSTSTYVFLTTVCWTLQAQGDYILLGALKTATEVGIYFFAYTLSTQFNRLMWNSFGSVLFPLFSSIRRDEARLASAFQRAVGTMAVLIVPICVLQAAVVGPVIRLFFAEKWLAAIPVIQLLSIGLGLQTIAGPCTPLLQAQGRFRELFGYGLVSLVLFLPTVYLAAKYGDLTTVAAAVAGFFTVVSPVIFYLITRDMKFRPHDVLRLYLPSATASLSAAALAMWLVAASQATDVVALPLTVIVYGIVYVSLISWLAPERWREASGMVRDLLGRVGVRRSRQ